MKIPLHMGQDGRQSSRAAHQKAVERDILAAKKGDWNAKNSLVRAFTPLLTTLAEKRSSDTGEINRYIDAGKNGLLRAAGKYKVSIGAGGFQIFALDFIESSMDRLEGKGGFFSRLFNR